MFIADLLKEKALLIDKHFAIRGLGVHKPVSKEKRAELDKALKRCMEIDDKLAEVNAKTFIEVDGKKFSLATALQLLNFDSYIHSYQQAINGTPDFCPMNFDDAGLDNDSDDFEIKLRYAIWESNYKTEV